MRKRDGLPGQITHVKHHPKHHRHDDDAVATNFRTGALVSFAWLVLTVALSREWAFPAWFGSELRRGYPRWRCFMGLPTQFLVYPVCIMVYLRDHGGSGIANKKACASGMEWAIGIIFALQNLLDFVLMDSLSPLMVAHHLACLVGHGIGMWGCPTGRPFYTPAIVALEVGSGFFNAQAIWPDQVNMALPISVTISHVVCLMYIVRWVNGVNISEARGESAERSVKGCVVLTMAILVFLRQKAAMERYPMWPFG